LKRIIPAYPNFHANGRGDQTSPRKRDRNERKRKKKPFFEENQQARALTMMVKNPSAQQDDLLGET